MPAMMKRDMKTERKQEKEKRDSIVRVELPKKERKPERLRESLCGKSSG
jgi:hypothetical protein